MIIIRVELHSAVTGKVTELARMMIANDGTRKGPLFHYLGAVYRGRSREDLDRRTVHKSGSVLFWPSERLHVWNLVATMLHNMGYGSEKHKTVAPERDEDVSQFM